MKNEIVKLPNRGDIMMLDENNEVIFIAHETYDSSTLNSAYTKVGVVSRRNGKTCLIINKDATTQKWAEVYKWYVTGWKLDGQPHETTISFYSEQAQPTNPSFTYTANSLSEVETQLLAWFDAYFAESNIRYNCYLKDEATMTVICESYNSWYQYTFGMSGLSISYGTGEGLPLNSNTYAYNGTGSVYKGMNFEKFHSYMHDTTSSTFNPTTPLSELGHTPVSYACYTSDVGVYARNIYGEGEDGYTAYLKDYMMEFPSQRGALGDNFRDGGYATKKLAEARYKSHDGTMKVEYPASSYCSEISYNNPKLSAGKWHLPTVYEQYLLYNESKTDYSDVVNESLAKIGGTKLQFANAWSCCRRNVFSSWIFHGNTGYSSDNYLYGRNWCVPDLLYEVNVCEH